MSDALFLARISGQVAQKAPFTNPSGQVGRKELPAGAYKLQLVVTKALAEANNPAHIETWTSPTINIVRQ